MGLKEILDKILRGLPADASAELKSDIADAQSEASIVLGKISALNKENEKRRTENETLTDKLSEKDGRIAELEKAQNPDGLDELKKKAEQFDKLNAEREKATLTKWQEAEKKLSEIKDTDKRFAKVNALRAKLRTSAEGAELSVADATHNLQIFEVAELAGALDAPAEGTRVYSPGGDAKGSDSSVNPADAMLKLIR